MESVSLPVSLPVQNHYCTSLVKNQEILRLGDRSENSNCYIKTQSCGLLLIEYVTVKADYFNLRSTFTFSLNCIGYPWQFV